MVAGLNYFHLTHDIYCTVRPVPLRQILLSQNSVHLCEPEKKYLILSETFTFHRSIEVVAPVCERNVLAEFTVKKKPSVSQRHIMPSEDITVEVVNISCSLSRSFKNEDSILSSQLAYSPCCPPNVIDQLEFGLATKTHNHLRSSEMFCVCIPYVQSTIQL
jgi:hypothetical protein